VLVHLTIRNYALIKHLELKPSPALNAITGETGAGKSIILGALGLLLGNRADSKVLLDEQEKCITEGIFNLSGYQLEEVFNSLELDYQEETIIRREISPGGKSRAFINDTPVNLDVLKKIGYRLMDIHSQHETLELGEQPFQLRLIDLYAGNEKIVKAYLSAWKNWHDAAAELKSLEDEAIRLKQEADFIRFQFSELSQADLNPESDENLESQVKISENAELIKTRFHEIIQSLGEGDFSARQSISQARAALANLSSLSSTYSKLFARLESVRLELDDLIQEIENESDDVGFDPEQARMAKERLDLIFQLERKHRVNSIAELIEIKNKFEHQVTRTDELEASLLQAKDRVEKFRTKRDETAEQLSKTRKVVFKTIEKEAVLLLKELGIPDAQIVIEHRNIQANATGTDSVNILFSANKGIAPRPLAEAASGGEFSRLMFVVKYIMAEKTAMPTLIMDEIDSGVSGEIALKLGNLMRKMSKGHQLIAITHLPQIAAKALSHFVVFKDSKDARASSQIRLLDENERVTEIARIISGSNPPASALQYARELMQ
jgi:DNA repair protein RecN (Recombination protein N)